MRATTDSWYRVISSKKDFKEEEIIARLSIDCVCIELKSRRLGVGPRIDIHSFFYPLLRHASSPSRLLPCFFFFFFLRFSLFLLEKEESLPVLSPGRYFFSKCWAALCTGPHTLTRPRGILCPPCPLLLHGQCSFHPFEPTVPSLHCVDEGSKGNETNSSDHLLPAPPFLRRMKSNSVSNKRGWVSCRPEHGQPRLIRANRPCSFSSPRSDRSKRWEGLRVSFFTILKWQV